jgi:hypothetical protein
MTGACAGTAQETSLTTLFDGNTIPSAMAPLVGTPGVWVGDNAQDSLYQAVPNPGATPTVTTIPLTNTEIPALSTQGSTTYAVSQFFNPTLVTVSPTGVLTPVGSSLPWSQFGDAPLIGTGGTIAAPDVYGYGLDLYDPTSTATYELALPEVFSCSAAAFDGNANAWAVCQRDAGGGNWTMQAYRTVLTSTWGVFPGTNVALTVESGCPFSYSLTMGEAFGQDSGPFTAVSDSPSLVSVTGAAPSYTNMIGLNVAANTGTAVVTVTDAHNRSVPVTFNVAVSGTCSPPRSLRKKHSPRPR